MKVVERRDEASYGAGAGEAAYGEGVVVVALAHFRQGDGGHGHAACEGVAHHGAEGRAGAHAAGGEAAAPVPHPGAGGAVEVLTELPFKAYIAHEQEEHERRPVVAGHGVVPELTEHVPGGHGAAHVGDEHGGRGHEGVGHGHAREEQEEHERAAPHAEGHAGNAAHSVGGEPHEGGRGGKGRKQGKEHGSRAVVVVSLQYGGEKVVYEGEQQKQAACGGEPHKGSHGQVERGGIKFAGGGVADHGGEAHAHGGHGPERGDHGKKRLRLFTELCGHHVHDDVSARPLGVGHGGEEHDDHEELGEFQSATERAGEEIPQADIQRGDEHHEQEEEHAEGADFLTYGFQMLQKADARAQGRQAGGLRGK